VNPSEGEHGVDPAVFRQLCGHFVTGVTVVTTTAPDGAPLGMTANSFASVSLDPPLISVNIDRAAALHRVLTTAERFAVNVLERRQEALSRRFAEEHPDRFAGVPFRMSEAGLPHLEGVLATLECRRHATFEAGDHTIVVGLVVQGVIGAGFPLLYYRGGYHDGLPG